VITSAATIMICVFLAFAFGGQRTIGEFGIGLSAAVLLDAFILRTVLVPAAMHVFGTANWWLPGWLDRRLPHLRHRAAGDRGGLGSHRRRARDRAKVRSRAADDRRSAGGVTNLSA